MTPNIIDRLRADKQRVSMLLCKAFFKKWELDETFRLIASQLRAEPLGLCPLAPEIEYPIAHIRRVTEQIVEVKVRQNNMPYLRNYVLPKNYGEMVTEKDITKINSGWVPFVIIRSVKSCGPHRIHFEHKSHTWDLKLRHV